MPAVLLKIGYQTIMLPDDKGVSTILRALSRGRLVWDRVYEGKIELRRDPMEVGMSTIPRGTKIVGEDYRPTPEEQGYVLKKPKLVEGREILRLTNGEDK